MTNLTDSSVDAPDASETITASGVVTFFTDAVTVSRTSPGVGRSRVCISAGELSLYVPAAEAFTLAAAIVTNALVLLRENESRP